MCKCRTYCLDFERCSYVSQNTYGWAQGSTATLPQEGGALPEQIMNGKTWIASSPNYRGPVSYYWTADNNGYRTTLKK